MDLSPALSATIIQESPAAKLAKVRAQLAAERGITKFPSTDSATQIPVSPQPVPKPRKQRKRKELITPDDDHLGSCSASDSDGEDMDRAEVGLENGKPEEGGSLLGRVVGQTVGGVSAVVGDMAAAISGAVFSSALAVLETFGGTAESSDDEAEQILSKPSFKRINEPLPADEPETDDPAQENQVAADGVPQ